MVTKIKLPSILNVKKINICPIAPDAANVKISSKILGCNCTNCRRFKISEDVAGKKHVIARYVVVSTVEYRLNPNIILGSC